MADDNLVIQGAARPKWTGKMVLVRVGPHGYMRMPEDEALARGYTPVEPEADHKKRSVSEASGSRKARKGAE